MRGSSPVAALLAAFALSGCAASPTTIAEGGTDAYEASLATLQDRLVVGWYDTRDGNAEIYFRVLDGEGRPLEPERRLTSDPEDSYEVSLEPAGADVAAAWYDKSSSGELTARLGVWHADGTNRWRHAMPSGTRNPVIRVAGGRLFCAWIQRESPDAERVWSAAWNLDGQLVVEPRPLAPASKRTWNLNLALDDGGTAWIVFDAIAGTRAEELFLVRIDDHGARSSRLSADDGHASKYPDLAIDGQRAALTWWDERDGNSEVYLLTADLTALMADVDGPARRVTATPGASIGAYLAWNAGRVGLGWSDDSNGQHEVFFQSFDRAGMPLESARRITTNATSSLIPAIRPWRSGFALAWNEYSSANPESHDPEGGRSEIAVAIVPLAGAQ